MPVPGDITTWMGILRSLLSAIGGIVATLGFMSTEDVTAWSNIVITAAGALMPVGVAIWSAVHHTTANNPNLKTIP